MTVHTPAAPGGTGTPGRLRHLEDFVQEIAALTKEGERPGQRPVDAQDGWHEGERSGRTTTPSTPSTT